MPESEPSMRTAVATTFVAVADFAAVVLMAAAAPGETPGLIAMTMLEGALIALAIAAWISYLRKYIAYVVAQDRRSD